MALQFLESAEQCTTFFSFTSDNKKQKIEQREWRETAFVDWQIMNHWNKVNSLSLDAGFYTKKKIVRSHLIVANTAERGYNRKRHVRNRKRKKNGNNWRRGRGSLKKKKTSRTGKNSLRFCCSQLVPTRQKKDDLKSLGGICTHTQLAVISLLFTESWPLRSVKGTHTRNSRQGRREKKCVCGFSLFFFFLLVNNNKRSYIYSFRALGDLPRMTPSSGV